MDLITWLFLMLVVVLGTLGQLSLKYAFHFSHSGKKISGFLEKILFYRYFLLWFICYVVTAILWLFVLRKMPLNQAFPALGLTYALVPLASNYFLKEKANHCVHYYGSIYVENLFIEELRYFGSLYQMVGICMWIFFLYRNLRSTMRMM